MKSALTAAGVAAALALSASAQVAIPAADRAGAIPGLPGDGLNGSVWFGTTADIAGAEAIMAGGTANGTLHSSQVDYPNGLATIVSVDQFLTDFLGVDAASVVGFDPGAENSGAKIFTFTGFISIPEARTYAFGVASDDGMRLRIGSMLVTAFDGDRGFGLSGELASFTEAGLYPIDLLYWANDSGESGVELLWGDSAIDPLTPIPQSSLHSTIPSPGSLALLSVAGMAMVRRKRWVCGRSDASIKRALRASGGWTIAAHTTRPLYRDPPNGAAPCTSAPRTRPRSSAVKHGCFLSSSRASCHGLTSTGAFAAASRIAARTSTL